MEPNEYRFERLRDTHYPDLCIISKSAFGFDPGISFYLQKNLTEAFGEKFLGFIAYSDTGEPAAFYGVYAHLVECNGRIFHAVQSGDTMTHKNHMGRGLFTKLAKMTYDLAKEKGVEFVFGSPNSNSYPGFVKKLDWICPERFHDYRIRVFTFPLAKFGKKFSFINLLYKPFAEFILRSYRSNKSSFPNSANEKDIVCVHRNEEFYRYKFFSGSKIISIDSVSAWIKVDGFLFLGDLDLENEIDFNKFMKLLKRFCFWMGIDEIVFMTSPGTRADRLFATKYKFREGLYVGYANFNSSLPLENFKMVLGDIDTF